MGGNFLVFHLRIHENSIHNFMYEHRSIKSVKISVGYFYSCLNGAAVPKCGAKIPSADRVSLAWFVQFCNGINQHRKATCW